MQEFRWKNEAGLTIYAVDWAVPDPRAVVGIIHGLGQHAEGDHDLQVRLQGAKLAVEVLALEVLRLQDGNGQAQRGLLNGRFEQLLAAASAEFVGGRYDPHDRVAGLHEAFETGYGEFGRTHKDDAGLGGHAAKVGRRSAGAPAIGKQKGPGKNLTCP